MGYPLRDEDRPVFAFRDRSTILSIEGDSLLYKHLGKSTSSPHELFPPPKVSICVAFLSHGFAAALATYDSGNSETVKPIAKIIHLRTAGLYTHWADIGW